MNIKSIAASVLSAAVLLTSTALPSAAYAEEPVEISDEVVVPTLPDAISISQFYKKRSADGPYLSSSSDSYLDRIYKRYEPIGNGYVTQVDLTDEQKSQLEAKVGEILAMVDPNWDDVTKVLFLHDYITSTRCYDYTYEKYSAYDILVTGTAVCQGYADAFWYLTYRLGIECNVITSVQLNHAWNMVKVSGSWYYIDLTWDDPGSKNSNGYVTEKPGRSYHNYFLLSDAAFRAVDNGQHDATDYKFGFDDTSVPSSYCSDTTFDEEHIWTDAIVPTQIINEKYYNIRNSSLNCYSDYSLSNAETLVLVKIPSKWTIPNSSSYYPHCYSGLVYNNRLLYFNSENTLYSYDVAYGVQNTVYTMTADELSQYRIYSLSFADGKINMGYAPTANDPIMSTRSLPIASETVSCLGHSATIEDQLSVRFYMAIPDSIAAQNDASMNFTIAGRKYSYPVASAATAQISGNKAYVFSVPVAAAEMTDIISGYVSYSGNVSDTFTYSLRTYADSILADTDKYSGQVSLINSMLFYGATAQTVFGHNTDNYADKGISGQLKQLPDDRLASYKLNVADSDSTLDYAGQSLSLKDRIITNLYFSGRNITAADISNVTGIDPANVTVVDGHIQITGVSVGELDAPFSITVGGIVISNCSVYSYLAETYSGTEELLMAMSNALYSFNETAKEYSAA